MFALTCEVLDSYPFTAQLEEQLRPQRAGPRSNQAPAADYVGQDICANPIGCVCHETVSAFRLEFRQRMNDAEITFGDEFCERQTIMTVLSGNVDRETQTRSNEIVPGSLVQVAPPPAPEL